MPDWLTIYFNVMGLAFIVFLGWRYYKLLDDMIRLYSCVRELTTTVTWLKGKVLEFEKAQEQALFKKR